MAIYRNVQMSFWTDSKVVDEFTPEDRYFYLYLMTNPHTNLAGCYEISLKQASDETGYTKDVILNLLERFEQVHNVIRYSKGTKEVLLLNWSKFNWTRSKDFQKPLNKEIEHVKNVDFKRFLRESLDGMETVPRPSSDGAGTTDTDTDTVSDTNTNAVSKAKLRGEFEALWELYPRKQGKQNAYKAYEKARKEGVTYEEVEQGIKAYAEYVKGKDAQYIKMGSSFFNQRSWQDDWSVNGSNRTFGNDYSGYQDDFGEEPDGWEKIFG